MRKRERGGEREKEKRWSGGEESKGDTRKEERERAM